MTDRLAERARGAATELHQVVGRVCGSCGNSCCHQGTMMGSHDTLRLIKGARIEPGREAVLREGLRERTRELRADLGALRRVLDLARSSPTLGEGDQLAELERILEDWDAFCGLLESDWGLTPHVLGQMLRFAGVRALALRALGLYQGGHAALARFAGEGSSFHFRGRRIAPPRCLFHSPEAGCLAGRWKPGKCANFYCAGEPNVLRELKAALGLDDFVLGNGMVVSAQEASRALAEELALGVEYVEPKVAIGLGEQGLTDVRGQLVAAYGGLLEPPAIPGAVMMSAAEVEGLLREAGPGRAILQRAGGITGAALYELAIALDRHRAAGEAIALVLAVDSYLPSGSLPHPLWADLEMSQPVGVLDLYVVTETAPGLTSPGS